MRSSAECFKMGKELQKQIVMAAVRKSEGIGTMNGVCPKKQTHPTNRKDVLRDFFNFAHAHPVLLRKI